MAAAAAAAAAGDASSPPVDEAPAAAQAPENELDESHYFEWTQKVLGPKGERASPAMKKVLQEEGAAALAELLKQKYAAEHKDASTSTSTS